MTLRQTGSYENHKLISTTERKLINVLECDFAEFLKSFSGINISYVKEIQAYPIFRLLR